MTAVNPAPKRAAGLVALLLAGCTSFSQDGGFNSVATTARERLGKDVIWVKSDADQDTIAKRVAE